MKRIKIIHPASKAPDDTLDEKILELKNLGFHIDYSAPAGDSRLLWQANNISKRLQELTDAFTHPDTDVILCGRGGYGSSDLIDQIDWQNVARSKPKIVVGFSDISALHSAISVNTTWTCVHGPMPNTKYWSDPLSPSSQKLLALLAGTAPWHGNFPVVGSWGLGAVQTGKIFGGCLSVLTQLIGTPFLPREFPGYLLFFEDVNESPPKILRCFKQWQQSGSLTGVKGIILGDFVGLESFELLSKEGLCREIHERTQIPVIDATGFGHGLRNDPILLNSWGTISSLEFSWQTTSIGQLPPPKGGGL